MGSSTVVPDHFGIEQFQADLLDWFHQNKRDLPWRRETDAYKIWVSEIMLQQTRVDTVIPYYERFMERFPTIEALAAAPEDELLKIWEGLGYYSRARNLQSAVKEVQGTYGGKVPDSPEEIAKLKGIGPYTAGAILSIAYNRPEPAVDGNVMRVLSRILLISDDIRKTGVRQKFEAAVRALIAEYNPSYFNQALMELGALVCTPKSPSCLLCPVRSYCLGREAGVHESLPVKGKARKPRPVDMAAGVVLRTQADSAKEFPAKGSPVEVLIHKRPDYGLLAGLWEFPNVEKKQQEDWEAALNVFLYTSMGLQAETEKYVTEIQHTFSHLQWNMRVYLCRLAEGADDGGLRASACWVTLDELSGYAFPVPHRKIANLISESINGKSL